MNNMNHKGIVKQIQALEGRLHTIKDEHGQYAHAERVDIYRRIKVLEGKMPKK